MKVHLYGVAVEGRQELVGDDILMQYHIHLVRFIFQARIHTFPNVAKLFNKICSAQSKGQETEQKTEKETEKEKADH